MLLYSSLVEELKAKAPPETTLANYVSKDIGSIKTMAKLNHKEQTTGKIIHQKNIYNKGKTWRSIRGFSHLTLPHSTKGIGRQHIRTYSYTWIIITQKKTMTTFGANWRILVRDPSFSFIAWKNQQGPLISWIYSVECGSIYGI